MRNFGTGVAFALGLAACLALQGCMLFGASDELSPSEVPGRLKEVEAALAAGDTELALELVEPAARARGLAPELRDQAQILFERTALKRVEELSAPGRDASELAELVEFSLPRQIAVQAGIAAARAWRAEDEPWEAYLVLRQLDKKFPLHYERQTAGDMLVEIGLPLCDDTETIFGWFDTLGEAQEILEYAIVQHPWAARCDEAYLALSRMYETDKDWQLAIERAEGLVLNHPGSRWAALAQADVPRLRLARLKSPEYDRSELELARRELARWLADHPDHKKLGEVRAMQQDCLLRLYESDMKIAQFYARIDKPFGARRHAARAADEADEAGDVERAEEARTWLAAQPAAKNPITGTEAMP